MNDYSLPGADIDMSAPQACPTYPVVTVATSENPDPDTLLFRGLRRLKRNCRTKNQADLAVVLAIACIEAGMDTKPRILGALQTLGLNRGHAAKVLAENLGVRWQCTSDGRYVLYDASKS
jgi:hypothetical protein